MGIKSTTTLKRPEALVRYFELRAELYGLEFAMGNYELGNVLDVLMEEICQRKGRACFENFIVEDEA